MRKRPLGEKDLWGKTRWSKNWLGESLVGKIPIGERTGGENIVKEKTCAEKTAGENRCEKNGGKVPVAILALCLLSCCSSTNILAELLQFNSLIYKLKYVDGKVLPHMFCTLCRPFPF